MIKLNIIKSDIDEAIGEYDYQFDEVFIGRSKKCDIILPDKEIPLKYLSLTFKKSNLVIINAENSPFYFVNGKKMSGLRKLKVGDRINFGPHEILIVDFFLSEKEDQIDDLTPYLDEMNKTRPELKFLLDFLESEILKLEGNEN
jgi:pSer/pThr/pTyr-binding forkhead associated (FHA) protein